MTETLRIFKADANGDHFYVVGFYRADGNVTGVITDHIAEQTKCAMVFERVGESALVNSILALIDGGGDRPGYEVANCKSAHM